MCPIGNPDPGFLQRLPGFACGAPRSRGRSLARGMTNETAIAETEQLEALPARAEGRNCTRSQERRLNRIVSVVTEIAKGAANVLLPYQMRWIADPAPVKVAEKSRRVGITWAE